MVSILLKAIGPKGIFTSAIFEEVSDEFDKETKIVLKMLKKVVRTWDKKPRFIVKGSTGGFGGDIDLTIGPDENTEAGAKFVYLDQGTSVRHAVMSSPFVPKSRVRKIGSWRGRGGAVFVSRQVRQPGIAARNWIDEIRKRRTQPFQTKVRWAVARGARRTFV